MLEGIEIGTSNGFKVFYRYRAFVAVGESGEEIANAQTEDILDAKLDKLVRDSHKVKNFPAVEIRSSGGFSIGKITSYNEIESSFWFTQDTPTYGSGRSKENFNRTNVFALTEKNKELIRLLTIKEELVEKASKEMQELVKQIEQPVTVVMLKGK